MTTYYVDPQEQTGSDLETAPLPPRPRVALDTEPNSAGFRSWRATYPNGAGHVTDHLEEAFALAALSPVIGSRVAVHGDDPLKGMSGTVTDISRDLLGQPVVTVELDHYGVDARYYPEDLEVIP